MCNSIINALGSISAELVSLLMIEGLRRSDKPDRPDRNKVVGILRVRVILLHDIRDKPQIVDNQLVPSRFITLRRKPDTLRFLGGGKLLGKIILPVKMQPEKQQIT